MSTRNQNSPKKPLPHEIYMRRRIAAGVVLFVAIMLLWWAISSLGGSSDESVAQSEAAQSETLDRTSNAELPNQKTSEPTASSAMSSAASSATSSDKSSTETSTPSASSTESKKDTCTVADLQVTATPGSPTFGPDQQPNFFVNIKNPTNGDCAVDFDANKLLFEVFTLNNYQRVWGDLDCNSPEITGRVDIKAGEEVNYELGAWSRTTSAPNQCDARTSVGAGSYLLYAHVGDNVSDPATFNLG